MPAGVAAEQRPLRTAQHFDALDVEDGEGLERHVFHHDVIHHHRHRLRCGEIEIGVTKPADVEARCRAAVRAFDEQAGHARGERGDFGTSIEDRTHGAGIERGCRDGYVLQVFFTPVGSHDDRIELAVSGFGTGGVGILRQCGLRGESHEGEGAGTEKTGSGRTDGHVLRGSCLSTLV